MAPNPTELSWLQDDAYDLHTRMRLGLCVGQCEVVNGQQTPLCRKLMIRSCIEVGLTESITRFLVAGCVRAVYSVVKSSSRADRFCDA